jgi:nicotinate phosphoribosyltransferase
LSVRELYRLSLATLTDLYELTMGAGYAATGLAEREAVFVLSFRSLPFGGGYAVAAGLADALEILENLRFEAPDIEYLRGLRASADRPLFKPDFLDILAALRFSCDIDAIPEGTVVFGNEPLLRVRGPLLQAQLVESVLLNVIGFQTLLATKAARVVAAAGGGAVLEFGLRRAQGPDERPTSEAWPPRRTCSPVDCTGSPSAARTPTHGSRSSTTSRLPSMPMPTRSPTT